MERIRKQSLALFAVIFLALGLSAGGLGSSASTAPDKDVRVINGPSEPVPVRDVDGRARQRFQADVQIDIPGGQQGENKLVTLPAGKRLVIEDASARGFLPSGQTMLFSFFTVVNGESSPHYLAADQQATDASFSWFVASRQTRIYADALPGVLLRAERAFGGSPGAGRAFFTISGYLEDAP